MAEEGKPRGVGTLRGPVVCMAFPQGRNSPISLCVCVCVGVHCHGFHNQPVSLRQPRQASAGLSASLGSRAEASERLSMSQCRWECVREQPWVICQGLPAASWPVLFPRDREAQQASTLKPVSVVRKG